MSMLQESDLKRLHEGAIKNDPYISQALGPNAKIERMKAASLRLGGQGLRTTYDDHLVIIGDAAGHIDPLTGEGIHTAIMVGLLADSACLFVLCRFRSLCSLFKRMQHIRWDVLLLLLRAVLHEAHVH